MESLRFYVDNNLWEKEKYQEWKYVNCTRN
jgi:hypothetical protein